MGNLWKKRCGLRINYLEKCRKKKIRLLKKVCKKANKLCGLKAKIFNKTRLIEKTKDKKIIKFTKEDQNQKKMSEFQQQNVIPVYLMERENLPKSKVLTNNLREKRREKSNRWAVPLPKIRALNETETVKIEKTGKRKKKIWKKMVTKITFVDKNLQGR